MEALHAVESGKGGGHSLLQLFHERIVHDDRIHVACDLYSQLLRKLPLDVIDLIVDGDDVGVCVHLCMK